MSRVIAGMSDRDLATARSVIGRCDNAESAVAAVARALYEQRQSHLSIISSTGMYYGSTGAIEAAIRAIKDHGGEPCVPESARPRGEP